MALGHLVDLVAGALYHDELRHGGWAADIGLVGRAPFLPEAQWAVEEATGVLWRTEPRLSSPIDHPLARP
jgi:hypothetical protein